MHLFAIISNFTKLCHIKRY